MSSKNGNKILLLRVSVYQLQTFEWRFLPHWKNQNSGQFYEPFWIFRPFWRWLTLCVVPKVEFFCKTEKIEFRAMFIKLCASLGLSSDFFRNWHKSKKSVETEVYRFLLKVDEEMSDLVFWEYVFRIDIVSELLKISQTKASWVFARPGQVVKFTIRTYFAFA